MSEDKSMAEQAHDNAMEQFTRHYERVVDMHKRSTGERFDIPALPEPLQAISNVIELKPDKRYLLVFRGCLSQFEIDRIQQRLNANGINALTVVSEHIIDIVEMPEEPTL